MSRTRQDSGRVAGTICFRLSTYATEGEECRGKAYTAREVSKGMLCEYVLLNWQFVHLELLNFHIVQ